jgi:hypothetical protein
LTDARGTRLAGFFAGRFAARAFPRFGPVIGPERFLGFAPAGRVAFLDGFFAFGAALGRFPAARRSPAGFTFLCGPACAEPVRPDRRSPDWCARAAGLFPCFFLPLPAFGLALPAMTHLLARARFEVRAIIVPRIVLRHDEVFGFPAS